MIDQTKEREDFESAAKALSVYTGWLHRMPNGGYAVEYIELAWKLWLARSLSSAPAWVDCSKQMPEVGVPVLITLGMDDDITAASLGRESAVSALFWYACRGSGKWAKDLPKYWVPLDALRALLPTEVMK